MLEPKHHGKLREGTSGQTAGRTADLKQEAAGTPVGEEKLPAASPRPGEGKRGEAGHIGYLLRQAGAAYRLRLERALADLEVTPPQFAVLTMIAAYPGQSSADIARIALLTPATVSVIMANLERGSLIKRRPHPVHGRIQTIELTEPGRQLLAICRQRALTIEASLLEGLSGEQKAFLKRWLVKVALGSEPLAEG